MCLLRQKQVLRFAQDDKTLRCQPNCRTSTVRRANRDIPYLSGLMDRSKPARMGSILASYGPEDLSKCHPQICKQLL
jgi:hypothetical protein